MKYILNENVWKLKGFIHSLADILGRFTDQSSTLDRTSTTEAF